MTRAEATPTALPPPVGIEAALFADLCSRLEEALDFSVTEVAEIDPDVPHNNRLLHLRAQNGREVVAKVYYRDDRQRLAREYGAVDLLRRRGFTSVPVPHLRSDEHHYAAYSCEPGATKPAADLADAELAALGHFAADLHCLTPDTSTATSPLTTLGVFGAPGVAFPPSVAACFSVAEQIDGIRRRLDRFCDFATSAEAYPQVRALYAEIDARGAVEELIDRAIAGLSAPELAVRLPLEGWRLNVGDFAPHNVITRPAGHPDGPVCVVDFEYFGWDDPAALLAGFIAADGSLGLSPAQAATFLTSYDRAYSEAGMLSITRSSRFARACTLTHVSWCAIHLSVMTPERVANKRYASPSFDLEAHLAQQTARFKRRLTLAHDAVSR